MMAAEEFDDMSLLPLETPVLKVSRPVAACSRCRNAKIKCDGKLPACSNCEKNGRAAECTSTNDQFARGKERSYVSTLETRIDRLQAKLDEAHARKPSVVSIPDDETVVPARRESDLDEEPPTPNTSRKLQRKELSDMDDLVSDFGFLSVNATARDFYGFTSAMSYARLILSACSKEDLPEQFSRMLPERRTANLLMQRFLNNTFALFPMFEESVLYASMQRVYDAGGRGASDSDHWMVRMVLAIGSASISRQRGDLHSIEGVHHICCALQHAKGAIHPGNIYGLQALLLLTIYAMLDPHHFDSWSLIGAASRAMADLGLHQDPPKGTPMPRAKLDLRRKVFYCIYALDRSTTLVQTRAFSFSDDSVKVKIPFQKPINSAPTSPSPGEAGGPNLFSRGHEHALSLVKLRQLQSAWYTDLYQSGRERWNDPYPYIWEKCAAMRKWFEELPQSTPTSLHAFFKLDLLFSYVYLLCPSPRVPNIIPYAQNLIFEYAVEYAGLMIELASDATYAAPLTFYDAMRVYKTGRQFLDVLEHATERLLDGYIPPRPEVKSNATAAPQMPVTPTPRGEDPRSFNTIRSITCLLNITRCLELFGIRWGYMSWHQRFQNDTANMLSFLHQRRQQELENMEGLRRQSVWQGSSVGSASSGSISYSSPPGHVSQMPNGFQHSPEQPVLDYEYVDETAAHPATQQFYPQQSGANVQYDFSQTMTYPQTNPQYPQQTPLEFSQALYHQHPSMSAAAPPSQQFAAWTGYGGPTVQDTLDEENAVPPESLIAPPARPGSSQPRVSSGDESRFNPSAHASGSTSAQQQSLPTTLDAPVGSPSRQSATTAIHNMSVPNLPFMAMQGSAFNNHQPTYQTANAIYSAHPPDLTDIARARRNRRKDRERALDESFAAMRQGSGLVPQLDRMMQTPIPGYKGPGFTHHRGLGYVCLICGRLLPQWTQLDLHVSLADGSGCVNLAADALRGLADAEQANEAQAVESNEVAPVAPSAASNEGQLATVPGNEEPKVPDECREL